MENITHIVVGIIILIFLWFVFRRRDGASSFSDPTDRVDPIAEAEVYLAYGRNDQAIEVLESHLRSNPNDMAVINKLNELRQGAQN